MKIDLARSKVGTSINVDNLFIKMALRRGELRQYWLKPNAVFRSLAWVLSSLSRDALVRYIVCVPYMSTGRTAALHMWAIVEDAQPDLHKPAP